MAEKTRRIQGELRDLDTALLSLWRDLGLSAEERTAALEDFEANRAKPEAKRAKDDGYRVPAGPSRCRSGRSKAKG